MLQQALDEPPRDAAQRKPAEEPPNLAARSTEYQGNQADPGQPIQRVGDGQQNTNEAVSGDLGFAGTSTFGGPVGTRGLAIRARILV